MATLNLLTATNDTYNPGVKGTQLEMEEVIGFIAHPVDAYMLEADITAIQATLEAKNDLTNKNQRWYFYGPFGEAKDNTPEGTKQSWGYGFDHIVRDGKPNHMFIPLNQSIQNHKAFRRLNKQHSKFRLIPFDAKGNLYGTTVTVSGVVRFKGYKMMDINVPTRPLNTGEGTKWGINIALEDPIEYNDNSAVIETGLDILSVANSLNDITIETVTALTAGVYVFKLMTNFGADNLLDTYSAEFVTGGVSMFLPTKDSNGAAITVSVLAAAVVNGVNCLSATMTTNLPTSGNTLTFKATTPALLRAAGIPGYESIPKTLTVA